MLDDTMRNGDTHSHRHSAYDLLKDFGVPMVSVVGMILSASSTSRFILFFIVAVLFGVLGLGARVAEAIRKRRARARNERFANAEFPRFRQFVDAFGDFVNKGTRDTLHALVRFDLSESGRAALGRDFEATPVDLWSDFWEYFRYRVARQQPTFGDLSPSIQEFNNLIGKYHAYCVAPVFGRLSENSRGQLSKTDISKLNGFHHKFQSFTTSYVEFLRSLSASHSEMEHLPRYLPNTDPL